MGGPTVFQYLVVLILVASLAWAGRALLKRLRLPATNELRVRPQTSAVADAIAELRAMHNRGDLDAEELKLAMKYLLEEMGAAEIPKRSTWLNAVRPGFWFMLNCSVALVVFAWLSTAMDQNRVSATTKQQNLVANNDLSRGASVSALDQAAVVFRGGYSRAQIKAMLDEVMEMNGVPRTEREYQRWTDVLVAMRQDSGATEIQLLRCIRGMKAKIPFPASAGMCAAGKMTDLY